MRQPCYDEWSGWTEEERTQYVIDATDAEVRRERVMNLLAIGGSLLLMTAVYVVGLVLGYGPLVWVGTLGVVMIVSQRVHRGIRIRRRRLRSVRQA